MYFLFYNLEKLYNRSGDDCNGDIAEAFTDPQAILVDVIYRNWPGAYTFELAILKNPHYSNQKKKIITKQYKSLTK